MHVSLSQPPSVALKVVHKDKSQLSFWDLVDTDSTYKDTFRAYKVKYNQRLPSSKGKLREGETSTVKILVHLMSLEMEELRQTNLTQYKIYLSQQCQYFPVSTNRGQLRTMLDDEYSLGTISNIIGRLMDAGVILKKVNTSRIVERIEDESGNITKVIKPVKGGRGDFILHINKRILSFTYRMSEKPKTRKKRVKEPHSEASENEPLSSEVVQKLEQPHDTFKDTYNNSNHTCGKQSGVPAERLNQTAAIATEIKERRDEANSHAPIEVSAAAPEIAAKNVENLAPKNKSKALIYRQMMEKDLRLNEYLPNRELDYYATVLFHQIRRQIYPHYQQNYLERIESHCKNILRLHISRLGEDYELGFKVVSRSIQMVCSYLRNKKGGYVYDFLNWIRLDNHYKTGTLKYVVDNWIPKEQKRLKINQKALSSLVRWQYAVHHAERLYLEFVRTMKEGFSSGVQAYKTAFAKLNYYFEKYELSEAARSKIRQNFADRTYAILIELNQIAERKREDATLLAIRRWQRQK